MQCCISEATTLPQSFAEDVAAFGDAGATAMEVWLTKLEQHLENRSAADTRKLLSERNVRLIAAAYQGGLLLSQGEQRKAHYDHFRRRLDICQELDIPVLILLADFAQRPDATSIERAVVSLTQAAQWAAGFNVKIALEFRATDSFCTSLDTALTLISHCPEPNVGVCLDVFHYWKGPSKPEDLDRLTNQNLAHVQLCDVAGVLRELATDADRVFPGEGDIRLAPILNRLHQIGYTGAVSLELMNPVFWKMKASQVLELGWKALREVITRSGGDNAASRPESNR